MRDILKKPFERVLTSEQKTLIDQIYGLCKEELVLNMTYPDFFEVLDKVKLAYQMDLLKRQGKIIIK